MGKKFESSEEFEELTDTKQDIIECAIENPDWTYQEIASVVSCSKSYVGKVHREYISEDIDPDSISWDAVDDDIYERIVAGLEARDDVDRVEQKYDLELSEGGSKEVDVAVWKELERHELLIIIECKFHGEPIEQEVVSGMIRNQQNSQANHTVLVSKSGFQEGAISQARDAGVDLYTLKQLEEDDAEGFIQTIKYNIKLQDPGITPLEIQLSPVGYEPENIISQDRLNQNPYLWDDDYTHLGVTLNEYLLELADDKDHGTHRETIEDRAICIDGTFYRIDYITFRSEPQDNQTAYKGEVDLFEEYELVMIDELEENENDRNFYSLSNVLASFVSKVENG